MPPLTRDQLRRRQRIEGVIRLASPALDLVLAAGERLSRIVEREDTDYYPPRVTREATREVRAPTEPASRTRQP